MDSSEVGFREHCEGTGTISYTDFRKEQPKSSMNRNFQISKTFSANQKMLHPTGSVGIQEGN